MAVVVIWAERWDQMLNFYKSLLGADASSNDGDFAHLVGGENEVMLHLVPEEFRSLQHETPETRTEAPMKPVFSIDSLEVVCGGRFQMVSSVQEFSGWNYLDLVDPDGNVVTVRAKA